MPTIPSRSCRARGTATFGPPQLYATNVGPGFAGPGPPVLADLNGDGIPDLIYPDYEDCECGRTDGPRQRLIRAPVTYPTELGSYSIQVVDLNGDGIPDIVDANAVNNSVSVLLGNGDGTFSPSRCTPSDSIRSRWRWPTSTATASPTSSRPTGATTRSVSSWATATAPSSPMKWSPPDQPRGGSRWRISTAMARSTSSPPIRAATRRTCSWATATARSPWGPSNPPPPRLSAHSRWRWPT